MDEGFRRGGGGGGGGRVTSLGTQAREMKRVENQAGLQIFAILEKGTAKFHRGCEISQPLQNVLRNMF